MDKEIACCRLMVGENLSDILCYSSPRHQSPSIPFSAFPGKMISWSHLNLFRLLTSSPRCKEKTNKVEPKNEFHSWIFSEKVEKKAKEGKDEGTSAESNAGDVVVRVVVFLAVRIPSAEKETEDLNETGG